MMYRTTYRAAAAPRKRPRSRIVVPVIVLFVLLSGGAIYSFIHAHQRSAIATRTVAAVVQHSARVQQPVSQPAPNNCVNNTLSKQVLVSISKRHLWACSGTVQTYDSAVVTGMENVPADLTPTGTYHIYAKATDQWLRGSDSTGSWNDHVSYWMPFLDNQYGTYGFHDATWRQPTDFGNIDPYSSNASHGCVELPLATAQWLYGWAPVGTEVDIIS